MTRIFYPKAFVRFTAWVGRNRDAPETVELVGSATPRSVVIERNDYTTADTCSIELSASSFPVLPRDLRNLLVQVHAGDVGRLDFERNVVDADRFVRFIGYVDEPELSLDDSDARIIWKARDYTALLLDAKRPDPKIVPRYSDRLDVALRRILDATGLGSVKLELVGLSAWPSLADVAPAGLKSAKMPVDQNGNAWDLVRSACDAVALVPRIVLDRLVVSESRGLLARTQSAAFIVGGNITSYVEKRKLSHVRVGVGLRAFDLSQRRWITALYPPAGTKAAKGARGAAEEKRRWYKHAEVSSQAALNVAAKHRYELMSREEFEGTLRCARMALDDSTDVTGLENGDRVVLDVDPDARRMLADIGSTGDRIRYLVERGYEEAMAAKFVELFESGIGQSLEVYVRKATHKYDASSGYELTLDFQNVLRS